MTGSLHKSINNPYSGELIELENKIVEATRQRIFDQKLLDAVLSYKPEIAKKSISDLEQQIKLKQNLWAARPITLTGLPSSLVWLALNPVAYFSMKAKNKEAEREAAKENEDHESKIADLKQKIKKIQDLDQQVAGIDEFKQRALVRTADCQLELLAAKQASVQGQSVSLLRSAGELVKKADELDVEISTMTQGLTTATSLDDQLGAVAPNRRYEVHQRCAELFQGEGSPKKVITALRRQLDGATRAKEKVSTKIHEEVRKQQLVIKRVFIDGNNLCSRQTHDGRVFVGTVAIEALATALVAKGYAVTVVFDQKIGIGRNQIPFQRVLQNFEDPIRVEQAPPQTPADELLMSFANDLHDCILSNDRFTDYSHKSIVKENRVLRVLIHDHVIAVPFLNLDVPYSDDNKRRA